jgi:RNA polymerase sigma-70 factor, ECF subfamily
VKFNSVNQNPASSSAGELVLEPEPDNSNLSRLIKEGDARSYELLFRRLYPRLCAYAQKFVLDSDVSEEIVQALFHSLWEHRDRIDENQSLHAYLFTSVKNRSLNFLESKKSRSKHAELLWYLYVQRSTENDNAYQSLLLNDLEKDLNTALAHLPKECKRIFELSRFEGLKYQEIAQRLNISIKTVETQMSRALTRLRLELREHLLLWVAFFLIN